MINMADGGFGGGQSPSTLLDEPAFYFAVKEVTASAHAEIERHKKKNQKVKENRRNG